MKNRLLLIMLPLLLIGGCTNRSDKHLADDKTKVACEDDCCTKVKSTDELSCRLMPPELQQRKETVLASLRKQVIEKKELENGYAFKFSGNDRMIDELTDFAKTERHCCDFFTFNLTINGDTSFVWLEITGIPQVKEFIESELNL